MTKIENSPEESIILPHDLFDFDYSEKYELDTEDKAKQLAPKILKFLEQFDMNGRKKAMEVIDQELQKLGLDAEENSMIVSKVYRELFMSKL